MSCTSKNIEGKCLGHRPIDDIIHTATVAFNALTADEQEKILLEQRASWLRGERSLAGQPTLADQMYYLTRVEGQLARVDAILAQAPFPNQTVLHSINEAAKAFLQSLRNALDPRRIDVA